MKHHLIALLAAIAMVAGVVTAKAQSVSNAPVISATASNALQSFLQQAYDQALNGGSNWVVIAYLCDTPKAPKSEQLGGGIALMWPMYSNNGFGMFVGPRLEYFEKHLTQIGGTATISDKLYPFKSIPKLGVEVYGYFGAGNLKGETFADTGEGGALYYEFSDKFHVGIVADREQRSGISVGNIGYSYCVGPELRFTF